MLKGEDMKKYTLFMSIIISLLFCSNVFSETWIEDYGYYENKNEISAKDRLIGSVENIFDFENKKNKGGEKIKNGRYYIETKYKGGNNGTDEDYVYLDELQGKDGKQGEKGNTGEKGDKGEQGLKGEGLKNSTEIQYEGVIKSWKRAEVSIYYIHDFNNDRDTVGTKIKHYWGKSWSEKELDKVNARLERLENTKVNDTKRDNIKVKVDNGKFTIEKQINF